MRISLNGTTENLELETSLAGSIHYTIDYADYDATTASNGATVQGVISTATTTTVTAAPVSGSVREISRINIYNNGATQTLKLKKDVSAVEYILAQIVLQTGERITSENGQLRTYDATGREKQQNSEQNSIIGTPLEIYKLGTAPKAAGSYYSFFKDSGLNGAWSLATPGLNGVNIDNSSTFNGLHLVPTPGSGAMYLRDCNLSASVSCGLRLWDLLWYNTALVVTTTTAQVITQPALPARDMNGSTNGEGVYCAMYVSATLGNGAVANTTLQYTNSAGTSGRTATIVSVVAAATIGQMFIFQLQAGDTGIRSIQSVTLGTTYVSGSISLFMFRPIVSVSVLAINSGASASSQQSKNLDLRLYNGTALAVIQLAGAVTATNIEGSIYLVNK